MMGQRLEKRRIYCFSHSIKNKSIASIADRHCILCLYEMAPKKCLIKTLFADANEQ